MQTVKERKEYRGNHFIELEKEGLQHIIDIVQSSDIDREPYSRQDKIKLQMIKKWQSDIDKLYQYFIDNNIYE